MPGKFELKKAKDGQFYFNLKAKGGEVILTSEMYKAKSSALNGINSVCKNAPDSGRYLKKTATSGKPFFVLTARNYKVIGQSEMYESERSRDAGIESVKKHTPGAQTVDLSAKD